MTWWWLKPVKDNAIGEAPRIRLLYEGMYMVCKKLSALHSELHLNHGNQKVMQHAWLKPYHGFWRKVKYCFVLTEARRLDSVTSYSPLPVRCLCFPVFLQVPLTSFIMFASSSRIFQCMRCHFSWMMEEVTDHYMHKHLRPAEVLFGSSQCPF